MRPLSSPADSLLLLVSSGPLLCAGTLPVLLLWVRTSTSYKDASRIGLGSTLKALPWLDQLCKGPIQIQTHSEALGIKAFTYECSRNIIQPKPNSTHRITQTLGGFQKSLSPFPGICSNAQGHGAFARSSQSKSVQGRGLSPGAALLSGMTQVGTSLTCKKWMRHSLALGYLLRTQSTVTLVSMLCKPAACHWTVQSNVVKIVHFTLCDFYHNNKRH